MTQAFRSHLNAVKTFKDKDARMLSAKLKGGLLGVHEAPY